MNVLIDASDYDGNCITGIGSYSFQLLKSIKENKEYIYTVFCNNEHKSLCSNNIVFRKSPRLDASIFKKLVWENIILPIHAYTNKIQLVHSLNFHMPIYLGKCKKVVTVYDVIWFIYPEVINKLSYLLAVRRIKHTCRYSDKIIAISQSTKNDLIRCFNCNTDKIKVIYPGIDLEKYMIIDNIDVLNKVRNKFKLPKKFVLWVGSIRKNKNVLNLCKAFEDLYIENKNDGIVLILAGSKSNQFSEVEEFIKDKEYIRYIGTIPDDDIAILYNLAFVFVYPSLYEGFGYPVAEAMACGTLAIVAGNSSLKEIVEDDTLYFDTQNIQNIKEKIQYGISLVNSGLVNENEIRNKVLKFSNVISKTQISEVYKKLLRDNLV